MFVMLLPTVLADGMVIDYYDRYWHIHGEEQEPGHMMQMKAKEESSCPMMEMMSSKDIEMKLENLKDGVAVKITSKNADVVKKIQEMAAKMKTMHSQKEGKRDPVK